MIGQSVQLLLQLVTSRLQPLQAPCFFFLLRLTCCKVLMHAVCAHVTNEDLFMLCLA
jgi:hypothetical protein